MNSDPRKNITFLPPSPEGEALVRDMEELAELTNTPEMQAAQEQMNASADKINKEFMAPYHGVMGAINNISSTQNRTSDAE